MKISGFEILEQIGTGGMGTVYSGRREGDGRAVAIKVCHPHLASIKEFRKRFQREASLALRFNHPGAAAILDNGETEDGVPYLVMELVEGRKLTDLLPRAIDDRSIQSMQTRVEEEGGDSRGPIEPLRALVLVRQVAETLAAAHEVGLIHRDIKPDNIMVLGGDQTKLLDFGLVKDEASLSTVLSQTGRALGTPAYMSPEQCEGSKEVTACTDIYSLGVVLYEMVTGERPFTGPSTVAFSLQHREAIPERAFRKNPAVPENVSLLIDRMLAKDPKDRHQSAGELIADIDRVEGGQRPARIHRFRKKGGRVRIALMAAVVLTFLAVGGAVTATHLIEQERSRAALAEERARAEAQRQEEQARAEAQRLEEESRRYGELLDEARRQFDEERFDSALITLESAMARSIPDTSEAESLMETVRQTRDRLEQERQRQAEAERQRIAAEQERRREEQARADFNRVLAEANEARGAGDLRREAARLEAALEYLDDPATRRRHQEAAQQLDRYTAAMAAGRSAMENPRTLEQAVASFESASRIWETEEAASELAKAREALANRRDRIAVIDFNVPGSVDLPDAGGAVAALIAADSALARRYDVIERSRLEQMLEEMRFQLSDLVADDAKAAEFGRIQGVPYILTGEVVAFGTLSVTGYILEVESGRRVVSSSISAEDARGLQQALPNLAHRLTLTEEELRIFEEEERRRELAAAERRRQQEEQERLRQAAIRAYNDTQRQDQGEPTTTQQARQRQQMWEAVLANHSGNLAANQVAHARERRDHWRAWTPPTPTSTPRPAEQRSSDGRFIKNISTGVITDTRTNLQWVVGPDREHSHRQAVRWVRECNVDGGGWRMPTRNELETLYKRGDGASVYNIDRLFPFSGRYVWTGERWLTTHWRFNFDTGKEFVNASSGFVPNRVFGVRQARQR